VNPDELNILYLQQDPISYFNIVLCVGAKLRPYNCNIIVIENLHLHSLSVTASGIGKTVNYHDIPMKFLRNSQLDI
jgi:hypothetical protein